MAARVPGKGQRPEVDDGARYWIDYHFALQRCVQRLWTARKDAPTLLADLEKIALLNIALVEAHESVARIDASSDGFVRVVAFGVLVDLYKREGAYHEALPW